MGNKNNIFRVAVLFAGQSRTYKKCLGPLADFFSSPTTEDRALEVQVDYFMHTWDTNTWLNKDSDKVTLKYSKYSPAYIEREFIENTLTSLKVLKVEQYEKLKLHGIWDGILYSSYAVNQLKCEYEDKSGFTYDLVIRTRPDIVFPPQQKFTYNPNLLRHKFIYNLCPLGKMVNELYVLNVDDVFYAGDSATMNTVTKLYQYTGEKCALPPFGKQHLTNSPQHKNLEYHLGPGTLMDRCNTQLNIHCAQLQVKYSYTIVRKPVIDLNLNYNDNYSQLVQIHNKFYKKCNIT